MLLHTLARSRRTWILGTLLASLGWSFFSSPRTGHALASAEADNASTASGRIEGRVVDSEGTPVPDVRVQVVGLGLSALTAPDGSFAFESMAPGTHIVEARSLRSGATSERVEVTEGGTVQVTLTLRPLFQLDGIVVSAGPIAARVDELFQSATVISEDELNGRMQPTLGETLDGIPGIRSTYNGPGASSPVIRGLGGDRVRVLESGLSPGDVSTTSPDHAVALDPASASRVEIIRGPATLLYGSSAVGGVVNAFEHRIPTAPSASPVSGSVSTSGGTVADERRFTGDVTVGFAALALRLSGSMRDTEDYAIPGLAELGDEDDHGDEHEEPLAGVLENSALETGSWSGGLSWVGSRGHIGAAISGFGSAYGVPGHVHGEEEGETPGTEEEEAVSIDIDQLRVDIDGELRFDRGVVDRLRFRFGVSDYEHAEMEGGGVGTLFVNDQWEGRAELRHRPLGPLSGVVGAQVAHREFEAIGDEAFTPPSRTRTLALFAYEEADAGPLRFQLGSRLERGTVQDRAAARARTFTELSFSAGARIARSDPLSAALALSRSAKLPAAEELFSDGAHLGTRSFEIGDPDLDVEVGTSVELTLHIHGGPLRVQATGFASRFSDFIYQEFTGARREGLPELRFTQADADFTGFEAEASVVVWESGADHLALVGTADYVRAELRDSDDPLPRIPPLGVGVGAVWEGSTLGARLSARRVTDQERGAELEIPTPGYTMLDATVTWRAELGGLTHEIILQGHNLLDEDARAHTSFLKQFAPLPGRDIRISYSVAF